MLLSLVLTALVAATPIEFVADDWEGARRRARETRRLIAVDVWATWCHTCLSMKNFVLTDEALSAVSNRHVWLSLDYDLPKNAAFFKQYPVDAFPTFLVIDPDRGRVVARWVGAGAPDEMARFFGSATRDPKDPFALGQRALAEGDPETALRAFGEARRGNKNPRLTQILIAELEATARQDPAAAARFAAAHLGETDASVAGIDFALLGASTANALPGPAQVELLEALRKRLTELSERPLRGLSADDRSSLALGLADLEERTGHGERARARREQAWRELSAAADRAPNAAARATFDAHRLEAALALGRHAEAEAMLSASEKAFPADFNPPWRLAVLYGARADYPRALLAIDRALARGYGPRRVRLYTTKLDLLLSKKDYAAARNVLREVRDEIQGLDPALVRKSWLEQLAAKEAQLPAQ